MEDYARILDFLPQGHPDQSKYHREPLAYALGVDEFKLFELVPKEGVSLSVGQRVYIGKEVDQRAEVLHVKRRVGYEELTTAAQKELPFVVQETVKEKEEKFVDFFNRAQAIAQEGPVQVVRRSRATRLERPSSGETDCEANRDGNLRPDTEVSSLRGSVVLMSPTSCVGGSNGRRLVAASQMHPIGRTAVGRLSITAVG